MTASGPGAVADLFAQDAPSVVEDVGTTADCDVAIVGSGMCGATMAWALRESGARVLVIEQGDFLPREWQNWSPRAVHQEDRYKNSATWLDAGGRAFVPGNYHYVGGNTKFYGATLPRMRVSDFEARSHHDGTSPPWPISYAELEPYYGAAERLYLV